MKAVAAIILAAAGAVSAAACDQSIIPTCAQKAILSAVTSATSCGATDFKCQCTTDNQQKITAAATSDVIKSCGQDVAINDVLPATAKFCASVAAGCGEDSGSSSSSSAAETTTKKETESPTSTTYASSSVSTTLTYATTSAAHTTAQSNATTSATATASTTSAAVTAGAAVAGSIGGFGMLVLGALAL
jgi:cytoskeletal protein RodZ